MTIKMNIVKDEDEPMVIKPKVEILKLSASSMKTYSQCPKKYFYNYISREQRKDWPHFDFGNLCHRTLEMFHQLYIDEGMSKGTLGAIMGYSFGVARKEFPNMTSTAVAEAKELIGQYLITISKQGMPQVKGVETSFSFNLRDDILLRGFLDRVDMMDDGKYHILDYKTVKNPRYLDKFQLLLYGLWLLREYPDVDEFKASYILLRHDSKLKSYTFNREDIKKVTRKVLDYADRINTSIEQDNWAPIPTRLCDWCDFKGICPTQQGW